MANTKIPAELSSTPGIIDNSNATAITIDSSENVGIGTSPENSAGTWRNLQFGGGNLAFRNGGANDAMIGTGYLFKTDNSEVYKNTEAVSRLFFDNSSMIFQQAGSGTAGTAISWSEAMRIDSSGNLLVGTTDVDLGYTDGDTGVVAKANGILQCARDSSFAPLYVQKLNNNGDLIEFNKDGTSVGSIATHDTRLAIGSDDTYIMFDSGGSPAIWPSNGTAALDNTIDIGDATRRFKDLYLSGGAYIGGTGSANKLDDYEEGTWTPTAGFSLTINTTCRYTKVGGVVTVTFDVTYATGTDGNYGRLEGLPFSSYDYGTGTIGFDSATNRVTMSYSAGTYLYFLNATTNAYLSLTDMSGIRVIGSCTYLTN